MWGYLAQVATVDHVQVGRTAERDADIRIVLATQRSLGIGMVDAARRSRFPIDGDMACPACGASAFRTSVPAATYAITLADAADPGKVIEILDCLVCELVLTGPQVEYVLGNSELAGVAGRPKKDPTRT